MTPESSPSGVRYCREKEGAAVIHDDSCRRVRGEG